MSCARNECLTVQEEQSSAITGHTCVGNADASQRQNETSRQRTAPAQTTHIECVHKNILPRAATSNASSSHAAPQPALPPHRPRTRQHLRQLRPTPAHSWPHVSFERGVRTTMMNGNRAKNELKISLPSRSWGLLTP